MKWLDRWALRHVSDMADDSGGKTLTLSEINAFFNRQTETANGPDIGEITYFTCLKKLAESLAKMPIHLMDQNKNRITNHESYQSLNIQPNAVMTPAQMITTLEFCRNHYGNGYAYINRNLDGSLEGLYPLDPRCVTIWINETNSFTQRTYYYTYLDTLTGTTFWIAPEDMIHVRSWITERWGLAGKSVREILAANMAGNKASQQFLNDLYQRGLTANLVVKYVGDLNSARQKEITKDLVNLAGLKTDRIIPVPFGWDVSALDLKLTDAQFFEIKKFSSLQIAAAFGVMPNHLNLYENSSYNNSSMQNLTFYVDTLLYNITEYEQELNRKLLTIKQQKKGMGFYFNVNTILRGDPLQQSTILRNYVAGTIMKPNEARRLNNMPPDKSGDDLLVNGTYTKLSDIGAAYKAEGGEGENEQTKMPAD